MTLSQPSALGQFALRHLLGQAKLTYFHSNSLLVLPHSLEMLRRRIKRFLCDSTDCVLRENDFDNGIDNFSAFPFRCILHLQEQAHDDFALGVR